MSDLYMNRLTEDLAAMTKRALRAEAQIQTVQDWASRDDIPAVAGDWMAGYSSARRDIRIILDGTDE